MAARPGPAQAVAERLLAEAQLREPCLLALDVAIAQGERSLARSGAASGLPRADVVLGDDGALLLLGLPEPCTGEQEVALVQLALALQRALRPLPPRLLGRDRAERGEA
jgi:hypothetical protein